ncbi:MAG: hypothetical protein HYU28_12225 [Actinobacteria bacterium]|nr:hypothetical protein [Actinomycetota bacterium]
MRLWASREVALGMVTLHELEEDEPSRRVIELNAAVDGADAVAAVVAWTRLPRRTRLAGVLGAVGAVAVAANYLRAAPRR